MGVTGGSPGNVLASDTLNGAAATAANVTISFVSSTNAGVTLNAATGAINVAAGTPGGTYTLTYKICDKVDTAICDTAVSQRCVQCRDSTDCPGHALCDPVALTCKTVP